MHKTVVDPFGRMLLLGEVLLDVRLEAGLDELEDIRAHDPGWPVVFLPVSRDCLSFTVFLDGLPGDTQLLCNRTLRHSAYSQFSDVSVDFHFNNHTFHTSCKT